jgi:endonuclease III related protein
MSQPSALPQLVTAISAAPLRGIPIAQTSRLSTLHTYYNALLAAHGPQHWWPGRTRFEIIVGAILTQNTSWRNVVRAIANLRAAKLLSPAAICAVSSATLAKLLRPSGYFRQKTKSLKSFVAFLYEHHGGSLNLLFATPTATLREQLLSLRGIGPETADSILLYAGKHPVFVVDAYSRRILERHDLLPIEAQSNSRRSYEPIRSLFESHLPREPQLFNEFHALIVQTGKLHCRKSNPLCADCPLSRFLPASHHPSTTHQSPVASHRSPVALL